MVNRITSGKRDREKLKQQKRLEKQKRKEERKSNGTSSFEDMIAYADENGVLHSTPQEAPKDDINIDDIAISTPKKEEMPEEEVSNCTGVVDYFNTAKGFGFIKETGSQEKLFFHISNAPEGISEGDKVTFEKENGTRGLCAVRIIIL